MLIVSRVPDELGWVPINYMVNLAGELFDTTVIRLDASRPTYVARLEALLAGRVPGASEKQSCLMVCANPDDLLWAFAIPNWRRRFRFFAVWIIDSFWFEWLPDFLRFRHPFDQIFVCGGEDLGLWEKTMGVPVRWLPWGTDVLRFGTPQASRPIDVLRVGRQPPEWDEDISSAVAAKQFGINFHPRPEGSGQSLRDRQSHIMSMYARSKYSLSFSNRVSPARYTHPRRDYVTGRWVDALAAGATVAGIRPRDPSAQALLWPGATLELPSTSRNQGLEALSVALASWHPSQAIRNYFLALEHLDWRWRLSVIAEAFRESPVKLSNELASLRELISRVNSPAP